MRIRLLVRARLLSLTLIWRTRVSDVPFKCSRGLSFFFRIKRASLRAISARPSPVEVVTPKPPTPVIIEGDRVLVYELHITNFGLLRGR